MKPKFTIDEKVYTLVNKTTSTETNCPACDDGKLSGIGPGVVILNGQAYSCPACYGRGRKIEYKFCYEADTKPRYITGISFTCKKDGKHGLYTREQYYFEREIDPNHAVYEDSSGDERADGNMLFASYEEAQAAAIEYQRRDEIALEEETAREKESERKND
jgi:hypothetical protein